jgi:hypothetical protein
VCYQVATSCWLHGLHDEAVAAIESGLRTDPGNTHLLGILAVVRGSQGQRDEAARIRGDIEKTAARGHVQRFDRALAAEGSGDIEQAYEFFGQALDEHEPTAVIHVLLRRRQLKDDPRYQALLRKMNLA